MIDPNCFGGEDEPCSNNFMWLAFFIILSASMLALTVNGLIALINGNECGKNEPATTEPLTINKETKDEI